VNRARATGSNSSYFVQSSTTFTNNVVTTAFPWTTRAVTASAGGPYATTFMQRVGYDNRNASGAGNIQMVSPMLTHWSCPSCSSTTHNFTASIGVMKLKFVAVPEPTNALMLVAGISLLGLLHRASDRE